jgi:hypothetical protein
MQPEVTIIEGRKGQSCSNYGGANDKAFRPEGGVRLGYCMYGSP